MIGLAPALGVSQRYRTTLSYVATIIKSVYDPLPHRILQEQCKAAPANLLAIADTVHDRREHRHEHQLEQWCSWRCNSGTSLYGLLHGTASTEKLVLAPVVFRHPSSVWQSKHPHVLISPGARTCSLALVSIGRRSVRINWYKDTVAKTLPMNVSTPVPS